jgi:hypothetical protein
MSTPKKGAKNQHTVPRCYLKAWTDPDTPERQTPYVWIVDKSTGAVSNRAPVNVFRENDFYTIRGGDGARNLTLEHGLRGLEDAFDRIRREILEKHKDPASLPRLKLAAFVAALKWRTRGMRDHWRDQMSVVLNDAERLQAQIQTASEEEKWQMASMAPAGNRDDSGMSIDDLREFVTNTAGNIVPPGVEIWTPALVRMSMFVLCCDGRDGFVTSDDPCVIFDPGPRPKPPYEHVGPTIFTKTIELTVPISPQQVLVYSHEPVKFGYLQASVEQIEQVNLRTANGASKELVANSERIANVWAQRRKVGPAPV